jgi:hypothetical protein
MKDRESILAKVKKMLTLARRATNENEAAVAAAAAHKYMERHNLCISDVDSISLDDSKILKQEAHSSGRLATWKLNLMTHVSKSFNCSVLVVSGYRYRRLELVGTKSDIEVARMTFDYLVESVEKFAKRNVCGMGRRYITSYKIGAVQRIGERLREQAAQNRAEVEEVSTATGRELAVVKDANLKDFMSAYRGRYRTPHSDVDRDGFCRGQQDGNKIGLNRQVGGSNNKQLT